VAGKAHDYLVIKAIGIYACHSSGAGLAAGQDLSNPLGGIVLLCNYEMHSREPNMAVDLSFSVINRVLLLDQNERRIIADIFNMII